MKNTKISMGKMQNCVKAGSIYRIHYNWKYYIYVKLTSRIRGKIVARSNITVHFDKTALREIFSFRQPLRPCLQESCRISMT